MRHGLAAFAAEVERALERLHHGFRLIFDLSEVGMVRPDAVPALRSLATSLAAAGLERMVQVQGTPGARVVARCVEGPYDTRAATSLDEAAAFLRRGAPASGTRKRRPQR